MARLISSGFELHSVTAGVEASSVGGSPVVDSTNVRSGAYSLRIQTLVSGTGRRMNFSFAASDGNGPFYYRIYLRIATAPSVNNRILKITNTAGSEVASIILVTGRVLRLRDEDGTIGSDSAQLALDTWYMVELMIDQTAAGGSHVVSGRVAPDDGSASVEFAGASNRNISAKQATMLVGGNLSNETCTTADWSIDDIAVNDNTGSFENSYPGPGSIVHLNPNAAGDVNTFATQTGGTAGSANNYTRVDEDTPDDATTYNGDNTVNHEDLFNVQGIASPLDKIKVVAVGVRFRNSPADATTAFKVELEKITGGTLAQSAAIVPNSTTWKTNATGTQMFYPLTLYQTPDSVDWTRTDLATTQAGYKITTGGTNPIHVSTIWVLVEYKLAGYIKTFNGSTWEQHPTIAGGAAHAIRYFDGSAWHALPVT